MRRIVTPARLIVLAWIGLGSTGCSNFRDLFSAHADVAAEAARPASSRPNGWRRS